MKRSAWNRPFAADYTYTIGEGIIAIVDLDLGNRSVTARRPGNDIDYVLAGIQAELSNLAGYFVIYRDSMGQWDGVRLVGRTVHFYGLGETDKEKAMSGLLHILSS